MACVAGVRCASLTLAISTAYGIHGKATNVRIKSAENIKRLKAVQITPDGNVVQITGRNAQGKSSVLDAITYALAGERTICEQPLRKGEKKGKIVVELDDDIVVTRTFTETGGTLTVSSKDGSQRYASPQQVLNKITGALTFDPLGFMREDPKQQAEILRQVLGLDLSNLEAEEKEIFEGRQEVNRAVRADKHWLETHPDPAHAYEGTLPEKPIEVSDLLEQQKKAEQAHRQKAKQDATKCQFEQWIQEVVTRIRDLEERLKASQTELNRLTAQSKALSVIDPKTLPDVETIAKDILVAGKINAVFTERRQWKEVKARLAHSENQGEELTQQLEELRAKRKQMISESPLPIPGLGFDEGTGAVIYNDLPLTQASSAEQLAISMAIGLALNPKLKVLLIRDGSLLDKDGLAYLAGEAEKYGAQVWIERVAGDEPVGVVIEDGMVKEAV